MNTITARNAIHLIQAELQAGTASLESVAMIIERAGLPVDRLAWAPDLTFD